MIFTDEFGWIWMDMMEGNMQYRSLYKEDIKLSALGLGCMRLPQGEDKKIDRPHALKMMRTAVERGVNYFDSAYGYHGGESEVVVGEALKEIGRDKVYIATKMPCGQVQSKEDLTRILDEQLKRLGVDTIDFYLFHAVSANTWKKMLDLDALTFLDKAVEKGKIRFPGFSHHDSLDHFKEVIDAYPKWVVAQIILNYLDNLYQAGLDGCAYAAERNVNIVIMEPLKGGVLTNKVPENVAALFREADPGVTLAEWALRWMYSVPEATCILSGMSDMRQLEENLDSFDKFGRLADIGLSEAEKKLFDDAKLAFLQYNGVSCTTCRYCLPCPANVDIPGVFGHYNIIKIFNDVGQAKMRYGRMLFSGTSGGECAECGRCEELCPQHLPIMELLKEAHAAMK